ncbi:hypothetical protein NKH85_04880 [Mesorhizobium sp. M0924]|uniref:hypothetical protein n=1 Tax=unclassified Mesorhizobium TaxID=325217 RepID=UPI0033366612
MMAWISLSEAERRVRLNVGETAPAEILQKLRWGELTARAERYKVELVRRNTQTARNQSYTARDRQMLVLTSDFWRDDAVDFNKGLRWDLSAIVFETPGFAALNSQNDFRLAVINVHVISERIEKLWPSPETVRAQSTPHRPAGRSLEVADAALVKQMKEMVARGEAPSPTAAAWKLIGKDGKGAQGSGSPESKVQRLVKRMSS